LHFDYLPHFGDIFVMKNLPEKSLLFFTVSHFGLAQTVNADSQLVAEAKIW
jgi:hypothetical protein